LILTASSDAGTCTGLTIGASNTVYLTATSNDSLYTLDLATGTATLIASTGTGILLGLAWLGGPIPVEV
jgi:outer membrane protein assembly factor BamB